MTDPIRSQPVPPGLSDEELMELMPQQFRDDLATVSRMAAHGAGPDVGAGLFRVSLNTGALNFARAVEAATLARVQRQPVPEQPTRRHLMMLAADMGMASVDNAAEYARVVLARWGHPAPQPPADGEVADVIRWLRSRAGIPASPDFPAAAAYLTRAADLLEQQQHLIVLSIKYEQALSAVMPPDFKDWWENSKDEWPDVAAGVITNLRQREELAWEQVERLSPPQPVPVSEQPWERDGWCDEQGKCWWGRGADNYCNHDWHYATRAEVEEFCSDSMPQVSLPSHALPLPVEVEG